MTSALAKDSRMGLPKAAAALGISRHRLHVELSLRRIRLEKVAGRYLVRLVDVEKLRAELNTPPQSAA